MNLNYKHDCDLKLVVVKVKKAVLQFTFDDNENLIEIELGNQNYIDPIEEDLHGVFVDIGQDKENIISLYQVMHYVEYTLYPQLVEDSEQEIREEEVMRRELSSPFLTGRV